MQYSSVSLDQIKNVLRFFVSSCNDECEKDLSGHCQLFRFFDLKAFRYMMWKFTYQVSRVYNKFEVTLHLWNSHTEV